MGEQKRLSKELFHNVTMTFAIQIIAISIVGWMVGDTVQEVGGLFILGSQGLTYQCILQILISAAVVGGLRTWLLSDLFFKKTMLLWRYVIMMLLTLVSTGFFIVVFRWFPVDIWEAWVSYIITFIVCFVAATSGLIIKTKLADRKYDKLLSDYKAKQNKESGE